MENSAYNIENLSYDNDSNKKNYITDVDETIAAKKFKIPPSIGSVTKITVDEIYKFICP